MRKEKLLVSIVIMMLIFMISVIPTFAASASNNVVTITANPTNNTSTADDENTANDNSSNNANTNATQITPNTNSASTYNNLTTPTTNSTNTTKSDELPYTGTSGHVIIFVIIAFVASAIFAYKKVTDYNI